MSLPSVAELANVLRGVPAFYVPETDEVSPEPMDVRLVVWTESGQGNEAWAVFYGDVGYDQHHGDVVAASTLGNEPYRTVARALLADVSEQEST